MTQAAQEPRRATPRLSSSVGTPDRASRPDPCNPSGDYTNGDRAAERLPRDGQLVPYAARSRATASSGSQSLSSAKIERLLDSLRNTRAAEATKQRAEEAARAIETEQHAVRMEPDVQAHNQGSIGQSTAAGSLSMQPNNRQRSSLTAPSRAVAPTRRSSTFSCCHRCHATLRQCLTSRCTPSSREARSGTLLRRQRSCQSQQS
jgi:hypothetical protein